MVIDRRLILKREGRLLPGKPMAQPAIYSNEKEEVIILKPTRGWGALNLGELWVYRELIYF